MLDYYRLDRARACPLCGGRLALGQGKCGPNVLVIWTEGERAAEDLDGDMSHDALSKLVLPASFSFFLAGDCHAFECEGTAVDGRWVSTRIATGGFWSLHLGGTHHFFRTAKGRHAIAPRHFSGEADVVRDVTALAWPVSGAVHCTARAASGPDALYLIEPAASRVHGPLTESEHERLLASLALARPEAWLLAEDVPLETVARPG